MSDTVWKPDEVETLRELHSKGLSARDVSKHLDRFSRNSVLSKLKRLGLNRKRGETVKEGEKPKNQKTREPAKRPRRDKTVAQVIGLKPTQCRWPTGDVVGDNIEFCTSDKIFGSSYCAHHDAGSRRPRN